MPRFVPRQRKHKVLRRTNDSSQTPTKSVDDSNAAELVPLSQRERDEKKRALKEELKAQQPKMSGKKQKRLEKYIV
jgi:ATP-dependent RNA helicase DHX37/DHR1